MDTKKRYVASDLLPCYKKSKHRFRDNKFGITWCIECELLSTKPSGILLSQSKIEVYEKE